LKRIDVHSPCARCDQQMVFLCRMIVGMFFIFTVVRTLLHSDHCLGRFREQHEEGLLGPFRLIVFLLTVHGALYVFWATSALLVVQSSVYSRQCGPWNPELYSLCLRFSLLSCLVGNLCVFLVFWRGKLLRAAGAIESGRVKPRARRAAPGAIEKIAAVSYDPSLFGDEDGRRYAAECPICLCAWELEDDIRVPKCGHAYHKECLGKWLQTDRTCALCRQDVTVLGDDLEAARRPWPCVSAARPNSE